MKRNLRISSIHWFDWDQHHPDRSSKLKNQSLRAWFVQMRTAWNLENQSLSAWFVQVRPRTLLAFPACKHRFSYRSWLDFFSNWLVCCCFSLQPCLLHLFGMTGSRLLRWNLLCDNVFSSKSHDSNLAGWMLSGSPFRICIFIGFIHICSFLDRSFFFLGLLFGLKGHSVSLELDSCCWIERA